MLKRPRPPGPYRPARSPLQANLGNPSVAWLGFKRAGPSSTNMTAFRLPNGTVVPDIRSYGGANTTYNGEWVGWCKDEPNDFGDRGEHCSELNAACTVLGDNGANSTGGGNDGACDVRKAVMCSYDQACSPPPSPPPPPPR